MDIDQRRDGAGIGELSFDGWGRPESKGIVRLPRARREMLPINTGCPGNGARKPATKLSVSASLLAVPAATSTAVVVPAIRCTAMGPPESDPLIAPVAPNSEGQNSFRRNDGT
jgi:hypothetical protein